MREVILSELVQAVKEIAGEGYEVKSRHVQKNNGVQFTALSIRRPGDTISAMVYVDQFLEAVKENTITAIEASKSVFKIYTENRNPQLGNVESRFIDKEFILSHVEYQVVNRQRNKEQLKKVPHRDMLDLSALYRVIVGTYAGGMESYMVNNKMLLQTGISMEELDKAAYYNTKKSGFEVRTMEEMLTEITGMPMPEKGICGEPQIYILTNSRRVNGANILLYDNVLRSLADKAGDDLFILPSSIHEVLAVPAAQMESDELSAIVGMVNGSEVTEEEILSYQVYKYRRVAGELGIA